MVAVSDPTSGERMQPAPMPQSEAVIICDPVLAVMSALESEVVGVP